MEKARAVSWWSTFDVKSHLCTRVGIYVAYRFHVFFGILRILLLFLVLRLFSGASRDANIKEGRWGRGWGRQPF